VEIRTKFLLDIFSDIVLFGNEIYSVCKQDKYVARTTYKLKNLAF